MYVHTHSATLVIYYDSVLHDACSLRWRLQSLIILALRVKVPGRTFTESHIGEKVTAGTRRGLASMHFVATRAGSAFYAAERHVS